MKADEFYQIVFLKFQKLTDTVEKLHHEIHKNDIDIAEIKQWKKDQDEFEISSHDKSKWGWNKVFGLGGIGFGVIAVLLTFI